MLVFKDNLKSITQLSILKSLEKNKDNQKETLNKVGI